MAIFGLYGDHCTCGRTFNFIAPSAGIFCDCGRFNCVSYYGGQFPHENPDMGMTREEFWNWVPQWYRDAINSFKKAA